MRPRRRASAGRTVTSRRVTTPTSGTTTRATTATASIERTGTSPRDDFDDEERDDYRADHDGDEDVASSGRVGQFIAIGAGLAGLGVLVAAARRRNGAGAAPPAQAATTHSAGGSRWTNLLRRLVQPATDEAGRTARRPEWRAELMTAQPPPGAMALPSPQAAPARQPGPCLYVEASRHRAVRDSDASCPHALALPSGAPLPTVARCGRCRVARIVLGGAHLGSTPLNAVRAGPAARADLEALARAGYQVAP